MNPQMLFHNAASNIICQVLFAKQFDYDNDFMKYFVSVFQKTSKIINGRWGMVSETYDNKVPQWHIVWTKGLCNKKEQNHKERK